jgi:class 3 adenylate cyclase/tetratricopeptide (TPR) repeat protein
MKCPRCQHENPPQAKFCLECGARVALTCTKCRSELPASAKFCLECGEPVASQVTAEARFTSPESYTPKHLAEKILTSKSALEGERKQVTVLFADLKGSMELLADRDPEEARKILDPVLERMMEAVHRYEGTVNQVLGDGIMALFGAPLAHEDHAVRACYAALRMQETVKRYAEEVHRTQGIPLQIRVGLNSGEVVVRSIGSDLHMDYTAVGQTTHLAARMEQMAIPGSILISPETLGLAEGYVIVKSLGPMPIRGLPDPVEVFEVVGAATVRSRLQATAARGLTRFVGRDAEINQLRQALERAKNGHGQIVAVVGEPGVGKSRLFWEFTHSHRTQGWLIVESSSVSYGKATAFLPLVDLLRTYFQIEARDEARKIREKVTGKLLSLDRALEPSLSALLWLLDVPVEDPQWQRLDPPQRRQQTLDGIRRLLLRECQVQPLLILFEDLHWIDAETQALLDSLVESLPTAQLLLLVNYRPEYQHAWGSKTYYHQIRIDPLPPESAEELLEALLGTDAALVPLKRLLIERTEGNPFFLEESIRTLVETKSLVGERGAYRLAKAAQTLQIPPTAQAILAARIDRLSPDSKRLLQAASVIGKDVPFALLRAVAEGSEEALRTGLSHLQAAEFLYEARLFPDLEYTFKHALIHEVAYGSLLQERRRILHAEIVAAIERLYQARLVEHIERLAHHALLGEEWGKAVTYLRQAGAKAEGRSALSEAVTYFEQALLALTHLPKSRDTLEQGIDIRFDLRNALLALGEFEKILAFLREAEALAESLDDQRRLGRVSSYMTVHFSRAGDYDHAGEAAKRALAISEALGDSSLALVANQYLGLVYYAMGRHRRATELLTKNVAALGADLVHDRFGQLILPAVQSRAWLICSHAELGEFAEGMAIGDEGLRIAETVDHPYSRVVARFGLGVLYFIQGEFRRAIMVLEPAVGLCEALKFRLWFPQTASCLGSAYALSGRVAEALPLLVQAEELAFSRRDLRGHSLRTANLSEAYLLANRLDDATRFARHALELSRNHNEQGNEAWTVRLLGEIASRRDPPEVNEAEDHYRQASALADELAMRPLVAHCHLGLGKLYRRTGKREQAQEHLNTATTMYRDMDMRFWLERAEAELRELA